MLKGKILLCFFVLFFSIQVSANSVNNFLDKINSKSYILIDQETGQVLKSNNKSERLPPASLTKVMTAYVVFDKLKNGSLKLNDEVLISKKAWKTGGSKTFIEVGKKVLVEDLIKGMIAQSGNDSSIALAEHISGSEEYFAIEMNNYAKKLGMDNSNFLNATGLPMDNHYSSSEDLGILAHKMINDFPDYYKYYSMKSFTYNDIFQKNRNRLLFSDGEVDGMKTGYTEKAGYCYVSSAVRNGKRLVVVVLGADKPQKRFDDAKILFNYGFNNFDTHRVIVKNKVIDQLNTNVRKGNKNVIRVGAAEDILFVSEKTKKENISVEVNMIDMVIAPINTGDPLGVMVIKRNEEIIAEVDVIALEDIQTGDFFKVLKDSLEIYLEKFN